MEFMEMNGNMIKLVIHIYLQWEGYCTWWELELNELLFHNFFNELWMCWIYYMTGKVVWITWINQYLRLRSSQGDWLNTKII